VANRILLPALIGSHPLAALGSFGLLNLATSWDPTLRLGFTLQDDWIAFLESKRFEALDALVARLCEWVQSDEIDRVIGWADEDVRVQPSEYRAVLNRALTQGDDLLVQFLPCMTVDGAVDRQKGLIKPSSFYMVSGQQSFLKGLRDIVARIRSDAAALFEEALAGPWKYQTSLHSLGWDPNAERLYALRHRSPTSDKPSCVAGAVLLALWALPLFPAVSQAGRAFTTGFSREAGSQYFYWPLFSSAIGLNELRSLVQSGEAAWQSDGRLRSGIEVIYRSRRSEFGQGYAVFRNSEVSALRKVSAEDFR